MHVLCPHCHNAIELVEIQPREEIVCASCGSSFRLDAGSTQADDSQQTLGRFNVMIH